MVILGIESSCDETAIAIVESGNRVLGAQVFSQIDIHKVFGGVVPEVAARHHLKVINTLVHETLDAAGLSMDDMDAIAVTQGPGLIGALLVGIAYAKGLALRTGKPLIPVNHVHAHVHGALLGCKENLDEVFPCVAAVVSGGHTNLYYMADPIRFELMAYSIDDACGECFDKTAKLLHLGYPGGPIIEKIARGGRRDAVQMPRMMEEKKRLVFSYSGLKTHMVNLLNQSSEISEEKLADICAGFQEEALGQIHRKIASVLELKEDARTVLIAGGVAANQRFQEIMGTLNIPTLFPKPSYCSDNGAMIAAYGYHLFAQAADKSVFQDISWDAFSRYQKP